MNKTVLLQLEHIGKIYQMGKVSFEALRDVDLTIYNGEYVAIIGPSGSGKSTLMQIVGCLSTPTSGRYHIRGVEVSKMSRNQLAKVRGQKIGFVFQNFNLLPQYDIVDNVCLPLVYQGVSTGKRQEKAKEILTRLGLGEHLKHHPNELSGGQKQRVAIARALITDPDLILADEPTGNLDTKSGKEVISILEKLSAQGRTVMIVTHDLTIANRAKREIHIQDGRVYE